MDASASSNSINFNSLLQQANINPVAFLQSIEQLLEDFGPEGVANAATERFLEKFGASLKELINNSDLPQSIKDAANSIIDAHIGKCCCDAETADAVENSELADTVDCLCEDAEEEVENECACSESDSSSEAEAEAGAEAENEGASGAGGGMTPEDLIRNQAGDDGGRRGGLRGGANWLEVLADSLSQIQAKFLNNAIKASEIMASEADNAAPSPDGGGTGTESSAFLQAQASYTANMQMFTIFSNQVSTSIKSIGEALAGIARKQ